MFLNGCSLLLARFFAFSTRGPIWGFDVGLLAMGNGIRHFGIWQKPMASLIVKLG